MYVYVCLYIYVSMGVFRNTEKFLTLPRRELWNVYWIAWRKGRYLIESLLDKDQY